MQNNCNQPKRKCAFDVTNWYSYYDKYIALNQKQIIKWYLILKWDWT